MTHKQDVIQAAIQGLIEGGMPKYEAKNLAFLLERVYTFGYNERLREIKEKPNPGYSDIISDGGMDPGT